MIEKEPQPKNMALEEIVSGSDNPDDWEKNKEGVFELKKDIQYKQFEERFKQRENEFSKEDQIEPKILGAVVGLNILGINTIQSCEGHIESGKRLTPWIEIASPNVPSTIWVDEKKIIEKIAEKHNIPVVQLLERRGRLGKEANQEAMVLLFSQPKTPEFIEWQKKNIELFDKIKELVKEFNETNDTRLCVIVENKYPHYIFLYNGKEEYRYDRLKDDRSKKEKKELLKNYQEVFEKFAQFLKSKCIAG